jgi:23S rRNA pseudouridine1911/1915/1917 synthase
LWETFLKQTDGIISIDGDAELLGVSEDGEVDSEWRTATVATDCHNDRIDKVLVAIAPEFSRSYVQQLIELECATVNGITVQKPSQKVKAGDSIRIELKPTPQSQAYKAELIPIEVVYQDEHLMVINKPAGLVVHPAPGNWSGTLLNALLAFDPAFTMVPRAGIVHRLDKDTSGLMVVARSRPVMDALVQAIAARTVSRQYLAAAHKSWSGRVQIGVEAAIGRDPRNRLRMAVVDLENLPGKSAKTDFVLLDNGLKGCLVKCILHTGRTHQIRVHMASIGHPLVGDAVYGGVVEGEMKRQALHAFRLAFSHPVTSRKMLFSAPLPPDFEGLLSHWGLRYNAGETVQEH